MTKPTLDTERWRTHSADVRLSNFERLLGVPMAELKRISILLQFAGTARPASPHQSLSKTEAISFCPTHRISSLTAVSCGGFLDFPVTGKLGETPGTRAARTAWSDCKSAPTRSRPMQQTRQPQRTQETINRLQNLNKYARKSCFLKNLRNDLIQNQNMLSDQSHIRTMVRNLQRYGYNSYKDYLQSLHWSQKRKSFFKSKLWKGCCKTCGAAVPVELHHRSYVRLMGFNWRSVGLFEGGRRNHWYALGHIEMAA